jgi:hypothetical protein
MGDKVGFGLSYRPVNLCSLAGRYYNPVPESTLFHTLSCEYLRKFSKNFDSTQMGFLGAWRKLIHENNLKSKISWHCPFKVCHNLTQSSPWMLSHVRVVRYWPKSVVFCLLNQHTSPPPINPILNCFAEEKNQELALLNDTFRIISQKLNSSRVLDLEKVGN